jgi:2,5-diketo-D-gluconate reductase A
MDIRTTVKMANGTEIPAVGLGVWKVNDESELRTSVKAALDAGYWHIDTATIYANEDMVGRAVADYGKREDIFITTKLWNTDQGNAKAAFDESLRLLQMNYVDLYMIHWPSPVHNQYVQAWKALIEIYESGRARAIGVSNFSIERIEEIIDATGFVPHMNQVERHPFYQQKELADYCFSQGIAMTAYSPLGSGNLAQIAEKVQPLAEKHGKTAAQVILRWHLQTGWVLIPKSVKRERVMENADIFGFALDDGDMAYMASLDSGTKFLPEPDTATF